MLNVIVKVSPHEDDAIFLQLLQLSKIYIVKDNTAS